MEIKIEDYKSIPLLENANASQLPPKTPAGKVIRKTFKGAAHLYKLLPTGSVLTFQVLSPFLTHQGQCHTITSRSSTLTLLTLCGLSCFFLSFTDSFRDDKGKMRHGVPTFKGLWVIDGSVKLEQDEAEKYRIRVIDFFHAFMSMLVFGAVALFDTNIVNCFYPTLTEEVEDHLVLIRVGIGVICSFLFLVFPTKRHGIGTPLSKK